MAAETYAIYLVALVVFFATPPDTSQLLVIVNSARHGVRRSLFTIWGDLTANCLQMTVAAFGLATAVAASAAAFQAIKWAGVAYLAWIGLRLILARESAAAPAVSGGSTGRLFRQGFLTSMANPFAVVFFGALFPQFIDPAAPILPQLALLGATYLVFDGVLLLAWAWLGASAARFLKRHPLGLVNRVCGALMIAAAALLASKDLQPAR